MTGLRLPGAPPPDLAGGLCAEVDPELFFPAKGVPGAAAQQICRSCEERTECLAYALEQRIDHGIWGGSTPRDRRRVWARRGAA